MQPVRAWSLYEITFSVCIKDCPALTVNSLVITWQILKWPTPTQTQICGGSGGSVPIKRSEMIWPVGPHRGVCTIYNSTDRQTETLKASLIRNEFHDSSLSWAAEQDFLRVNFSEISVGANWARVVKFLARLFWRRQTKKKLIAGKISARRSGYISHCVSIDSRDQSSKPPDDHLLFVRLERDWDHKLKSR